MKFLLDESADRRLKPYLQSLGHDVTSIVPDYTAGIADEEVLAISIREQRVLISDDKDFGELIFRRKWPFYGVVLYRLGRTELAQKISMLDSVLSTYSDPRGLFLVLTQSGIRVGTP